ncbi:MAG: hypothetical protein AAGK78_11495 [Planctomycetota bacterium]
MSLLEGIHTCRSELSPAEKRVADVVLDDPDRAMRLPMAIADEAASIEAMTYSMASWVLAWAAAIAL